MKPQYRGASQSPKVLCKGPIQRGVCTHILTHICRFWSFFPTDVEGSGGDGS